MCACACVHATKWGVYPFIETKNNNRLLLTLKEFHIPLRIWLCTRPSFFSIQVFQKEAAGQRVSMRCREDPSLGTDREAEPPGFWTGRIRSWHKL